MASTHFSGPLHIGGDNVINTVTNGVNYVELSQSTTGTAAIVSAKGDNTNIDLLLQGKGTASVLLGNWGTAQVTQVAVGSYANVTVNAQKGAINIPNFDIVAGSAFLINLTNNKLYDTANPRSLLCTIGRGSNTINGGITVQADVGNGSALLHVISATTSVLNGSISVNFLVI